MVICVILELFLTSRQVLLISILCLSICNTLPDLTHFSVGSHLSPPLLYFETAHLSLGTRLCLVKVMKTPVTYISFPAEGELLNYRHRTHFLHFALQKPLQASFIFQPYLCLLALFQNKKHERMWRTSSQIISVIMIHM